MKRDLTHGPIFGSIVRLAVPLLGASFFQTAYVMVNMAWLGRSGADDVAAAGVAGLFNWFGISLALMPRVGGEVKIAHAMGRKDLAAASRLAFNSLTLTLGVALLYGLVLALASPHLVSFFGFSEGRVRTQATLFLQIAAWSFPASQGLFTYTGIQNSMGDSRRPFQFSALALVVTALLDPFLIFGWGPFPRMGAPGAAVATVLGQTLAFTLAFRSLLTSWPKATGHSFFQRIDGRLMRGIVRLGLPAALQSGTFAIFAMMVTRTVTVFGALPMAVQSIGTQIEAVTYQSANGLAAASGAFVGQNYGAGFRDRIRRGCRVATLITAAFGLSVSLAFIACSRPIFSLFMQDHAALALGSLYLSILATSQLFMALEIVLTGAFRGLGMTGTPFVVSFWLTGARVPLAILWTSGLGLGVASVWWTVSLSSVAKGILLLILLERALKKLK